MLKSVSHPKVYSVWALLCNKFFCKLHKIAEDGCAMNNHSCKFVFLVTVV